MGEWRSAAVYPFPSPAIQLRAFTGDLVVAVTSVVLQWSGQRGREREREGERGFKRSTVARLVGRSVVFVVASLFHVIVLSSPPSSVPSPPFADVQSVDGRADGLLLHLLFHLRMSDPSREERSGEQKSIVRSLLKNVHNSFLLPSAAPCSSFLPLAPRRFFLRSESERASAHGGKWLLSN